MGKGSNVQKKQQARERHLKAAAKNKTPEERAVAKKRATADAQAATCQICRMTFTIAQCRGNPPSQLKQHVDARHGSSSYDQCFSFLYPDGTRKDDAPQ